MTHILTYHFDNEYLKIRQPYRNQHFNYITPYLDSGALLLGGATEASPPKGVLIFKGVSIQEIENFAKNDPYIINKVAVSFSIVQWNVVAGSLFNHQ